MKPDLPISFQHRYTYIFLARKIMSFDGINIPQKLVPKSYLQLGLDAQRLKQRNFKVLLEKVTNAKNINRCNNNNNLAVVGFFHFSNFFA